MKKAHYRGIPCYYDEDTGELKGRNFLYDLLVMINVWIDFNIIGLDGLPIWVDVDEDDDDNWEDQDKNWDN